MGKPKIRFKGYQEDWEQRKLGEVYTERNERGNDSLPILSVSIHSGVSDGELDAENLGKTVRRSEDKSTYKHVYEGDLIFNMMRAWQGAIGVAKSEGMISPAYISAIPSENLYPLFMNYLLRRKEIIGQINNLSYGVTDFRKRLYWDSFVKVVCNIPSVEEQKKIAGYFDSLDHLITLHQRKCEETKTLKKYMLQKMFPQTGQLVPEIRFSGFTEDWEQRKLNEIADKVSEKNKNNEFSEPFTNSAEQGIISQKDYFDREIVNNENLDGYYIVRNDDFIYNPRISVTAPVGPINRNRLGRNGVMSPLYTVFRTHDIDNLYLEFYFKTTSWHRFMKLNGDSGARFDRFTISSTQFMEMPIPYPALEEQQKIGEYFDSLDHLITLHQRKCDELRNIKKFMLQHMFI